MVLPKTSSPKALGGSSINSPRETLSLLTRHLLKSTRGLEHKLPPRDAIFAHATLLKSTQGLEHKLPTRDAIFGYATLLKSTRGLEQKLPPRDAIFAHAMLLKALGGSSTNSPE